MEFENDKDCRYPWCHKSEVKSNEVKRFEKRNETFEKFRIASSFESNTLLVFVIRKKNFHARFV